MPNIFYHSRHIELWDFLSKNPTQNKEDWDGWDKYGHVLYYCFACAYGKSNTCKDCPLEFTGVKYCCLGGLWEDWLSLQDEEGYVYDVDKRIELAERIRDLPVREGVEVI